MARKGEEEGLLSRTSLYCGCCSSSSSKLGSTRNGFVDVVPCSFDSISVQVAEPQYKEKGRICENGELWTPFVALLGIVFSTPLTHNEVPHSLSYSPTQYNGPIAVTGHCWIGCGGCNDTMIIIETRLAITDEMKTQKLMAFLVE